MIVYGLSLLLIKLVCPKVFFSQLQECNHHIIIMPVGNHRYHWYLWHSSAAVNLNITTFSPHCCCYYLECCHCRSNFNKQANKLYFVLSSISFSALSAVQWNALTDWIQGTHTHRLWKITHVQASKQTAISAQIQFVLFQACTHSHMWIFWAAQPSPLSQEYFVHLFCLGCGQ